MKNWLWVDVKEVAFIVGICITGAVLLALILFGFTYWW